MSIFVYFASLGLGRLWIWLLQTNGLTEPLWNLHPKLKELSECDLCLGFWVYLIMGLFLPAPFGVWPYLVEVILLAGVSTFVMHLIRLGWESKFGVTIV